MKGRIFSTLLLWSLIVATASFFGAQGAVILATLAAALMQYELYRMLSHSGKNPLVCPGICVGVFVSLTPLLGKVPLVGGTGLVIPAILLFSVAALLRKPRGNVTDALGSTLLGLLLGPCTLLFISLAIFQFGPAKEGLFMALWIVMVTKFTDMGALLVGLAFGRHKLAPAISPKKTWEGVFGGIAICMISSAVYVHFAAPVLPTGFTPLLSVALSLPLAVASVFADLLESSFKRECGVKDSGGLLPGIGGVFDLTDSFMLSAPLAYYLTVLTLA